MITLLRIFGHRPSRAIRTSSPRAAVSVVAALALAASSAAIWSVATASAATPETIWGNSAPALATVDSDNAAVELGTRFTAVTNGQATGIRFYKTAENKGTHTGSLWSSTGGLLARATFSGETSSGWQTASLSAPVKLSAGTTYVVSYYSPNGRYTTTEWFKGASKSPNLSVPSSNVGVYAYGSKSTFPKLSWHASQYWVDLTFSAGSSATTSATPVASASTATPATSTSAASSTAPSSTSATTAAGTTAPSTTVTAGGVTSTTPSTAPSVTVTAATPRPTTAAPSATTPPPGVTNCVSVPSGCGYPDATTTGVPAGTALKASVGTLTLSTNGQVVSGLNITGNVLITASNVTLQRSRVTGGSWNIIQISESATNVTIQDVEINGTGSVEGANGIYGSATVLRTNIYGIENGIVPLSNSVIRDNYIHGLKAPGSPHYDGIQIDGGQNNVKVTHNYIDMHEWSQTSAVMIDNYFGPISNIAVDNNLLVGGGYTVYSDGQFNSSVISGVSFTNNRFGKGCWGYAAINGPLPVWTGNVDATSGTAIAR